MSSTAREARSKRKMDRFRKFSYHETNSKLSRLSHEELMIPLVYWNCPPQHTITAMYIQKSMRSGDIIITGSDSGEFIIWKPSNTMHHPAFECKADDKPVAFTNISGSNGVKSGAHGVDEEWVPIAMTFSTNTSPVVSILGSFQHKEQAAFMGKPVRSILALCPSLSGCTLLMRL